MTLTQDYSRVAALPHSRNRLKDVDLEELSIPLGKAFSLTGLDRRYKKMSLDEIVSELTAEANKTMLEDEIGWTPDELVRDLNQLLE